MSLIERVFPRVTCRLPLASVRVSFTSVLLPLSLSLASLHPRTHRRSTFSYRTDRTLEKTQSHGRVRRSAKEYIHPSFRTHTTCLALRDDLPYTHKKTTKRQAKEAPRVSFLHFFPPPPPPPSRHSHPITHPSIYQSEHSKPPLTAPSRSSRPRPCPAPSPQAHPPPRSHPHPRFPHPSPRRH